MSQNLFTIAAIFLSVYIYLFYSVFKGGKGNDFFAVMDSTPLNHTLMLNKTGPQIRLIAENLLKEFEYLKKDEQFWMIDGYRKSSGSPSFSKYNQSERYILSKELETQKDKSRSFYNFGKDLPGGQMTWVEEYTKIIANLDSHLNQCSFQNSNISLADQTDFKNYILSDQNFLEKYAQLTT